MTVDFSLSLHDALPIWARLLAPVQGVVHHEPPVAAVRPEHCLGGGAADAVPSIGVVLDEVVVGVGVHGGHRPPPDSGPDRKSTRLNSSHVAISYAVFCL